MNQQEQDNLKVGDRIILGKHIDADGTTFNWSPEMDKYVGKVATVVSKHELTSTSGTRSDYVRVDLDGGLWVWELPYQQVVSLPATTAKSSDPGGCKCTKCGDFVPYAEPPQTFVCYSCRNRS